MFAPTFSHLLSKTQLVVSFFENKPKNFGAAFFVEMCWGLCLACLALSVGAIVKLNPSGGLPWMWSAPSTWSSNSVPTQDDDVEVEIN